VRLSRKSEYACLALIDLAEQHDQGPVKIGDISHRKSIPKKYLEQILLTLRGAGFVRSTRGPGGGYNLAHKPSEISLAEIIRLLDGALAPVESVSEYFYSHSPVEAHEKLLKVFKEIRDYEARLLERTTLAKLL